MNRSKPILHARDHMAGGADPIPGLVSPTGDFVTTILGSSDLLAYWRLGEIYPGPYADTSAAYTSPADLDQIASSSDPVTATEGALTSGDDGAQAFTYDGTTHADGSYLEWAGADSARFDFSTPFTFAAWVALYDPAFPNRRGFIGGTSSFASGGPAGIIEGWGLYVVYPTMQVRFSVGGFSLAGEVYAQTTGGVAVGEWIYMAGTWDGTDVNLYMNGTFVDSAAAESPGGVANGIRFGWALLPNPDGTVSGVTNGQSFFIGGIDEAAVWNRALTQEEINILYLSGVGSLDGGGAVIISDGSGGVTWGQVGTGSIKNGAVTTAKILDGTILDEDVDAAAAIAPTKLDHPGGTTVFLRGDGTWAAPAAAGPATDTQVWMPLVDSDGTVVLDSHGVIPTLISL